MTAFAVVFACAFSFCMPVAYAAEENSESLATSVPAQEQPVESPEPESTAVSSVVLAEIDEPSAGFQTDGMESSAEPTSLPTSTAEPSSTPLSSPTLQPSPAEEADTPDEVDPYTESDVPMLLGVGAPLAETIPVVDDTLAADYPIVVIRASDGNQTGYATMADAFTAIGGNTDDFTVVFTQDYTMVQTTDMNAMAGGGSAANSLNITSTYAVSSAPDAYTTKTITISGAKNSLQHCWTLNADAVIHDINFSITGACVNMYGTGHNLTMGHNVALTSSVNSGRIQLYGGGKGDYTGDTSLTILSGNYQYVFGGNYTGTQTGNVCIDIGGTAQIAYLYAASQNTSMAAGYNAEIYVNGSEGARTSVYGGYTAQACVPEGSRVDVYLTDVTNSVTALSPKTNNNGTSVIHIQGNTTLAATAPISATDLIVEQDCSFISGGVLTLAGSLTLEENAGYIRRSANTQTVGDLNVTGPNAVVTLFKSSASAAPVVLNVNGSYTHPENPLQFALNNSTGAAIPPTSGGGDILLTYGNAANAKAEDYKRLYDTYNGIAYDIAASGANIVLSYTHALPTYYRPTSTPELFYYVEIGGSSNTDGGTHIVYRKYVYDTDNDTWNAYASDADGNISGDPVDQTKERPQPDDTYRSNYEFATSTMIRMDEIGKYRLTAAAGVNAHCYNSTSMTASGNKNDFINTDNMGASNASWAILNQTDASCTIHKAYLVMTTTLAGNASDDSRSNIMNRPMTLIAEDGAEMQTNGYLPDGFVVAKGSTELDTDNPVLLFDRGNLGGIPLGEAMTITDVTDFVKTHGYGKYYGVDIPAESQDPDASIAWRLIVVEEDSSMDYYRKVGIQMGPISNGNTTVDVPTSITLYLDGFTTPDSFAGETFGGQLLMIGSDNLTGATSGGSTGSNLHNTFCPDPTNRADTIIAIGSNDPSTTETERPVKNGTSYWSQGIMDIDGVKLSGDQVCHTESNGSMGLDLTLLNITNEQNTEWETNGGHNLYLTSSSPSVRLNSARDAYGTGYIDVLALATDIAVPKFHTEITHTDISTAPIEGANVPAGASVHVNAVVTNITPITSIVVGSFNTRVKVDIDEKLSNIRPANGNAGDPIIATFKNYNPQTHETENIPVTGIYNEADHSILFDFGSVFDWSDDPAGAAVPLFNSAADEMVIDFWADTDSTPTIDDAEINYINTVGVSGQTLYQNNEVVETPYMRYDFDTDSFNTYSTSVTFEKDMSGAYADLTKPCVLWFWRRMTRAGSFARADAVIYRRCQSRLLRSSTGRRNRNNRRHRTV